MNTPRKVVINSCDECPYFDNEYYSFNETCTKLDRIMKETTISTLSYHPIPEDCPLEKHYVY